ncbi:MAG: hypothetical protein ABIE84_05000 [bacterium]
MSGIGSEKIGARLCITFDTTLVGKTRANAATAGQGCGNEIAAAGGAVSDAIDRYESEMGAPKAAADGESDLGESGDAEPPIIEETVRPPARVALPKFIVR